MQPPQVVCDLISVLTVCHVWASGLLVGMMGYMDNNDSGPSVCESKLTYFQAQDNKPRYVRLL